MSDTLTSFVQSVFSPEHGRLTDLSFLCQQGAVDIQTQAGTFIMAAECYYYSTMNEHGEARHEKSERVRNLYVIVPAKCCSLQRRIFVNDDLQCANCASEIVLGSAVAIVGVDENRNSYWVNKDEFIGRMAGEMNADTFTSVIYANDLYEWAEDHYEAEQ